LFVEGMTSKLASSPAKKEFHHWTAQADEKQLELLFFSGQSIIFTFAPFYKQQ
jgi:hypothetical protein